MVTYEYSLWYSLPAMRNIIFLATEGQRHPSSSRQEPQLGDMCSYVQLKITAYP